MTAEQEQKLGEMVLDSIVKNGGFGCFGVKNVREVTAKSSRAAGKDTATIDMFSGQEDGAA